MTQPTVTPLPITHSARTGWLDRLHKGIYPLISIIIAICVGWAVYVNKQRDIDEKQRRIERVETELKEAKEPERDTEADDVIDWIFRFQSNIDKHRGFFMEQLTILQQVSDLAAWHRAQADGSWARYQTLAKQQIALTAAPETAQLRGESLRPNIKTILQGMEWSKELLEQKLAWG